MTVRGMGSGPTAKPLHNLARYICTVEVNFNSVSCQQTVLGRGERLYRGCFVQSIVSVCASEVSPFLSFRALEGSFRSLNNLLERLHHSEFFYFTPSRGRFISIGLFMPPLGLLLAPLMLEISFYTLQGKIYIAKFFLGRLTFYVTTPMPLVLDNIFTSIRIEELMLVVEKERNEREDM